MQRKHLYHDYLFCYVKKNSISCLVHTYISMLVNTRKLKDCRHGNTIDFHLIPTWSTLAVKRKISTLQHLWTMLHQNTGKVWNFNFYDLDFKGMWAISIKREMDSAAVLSLTTRGIYACLLWPKHTYRW